METQSVLEINSTRSPIRKFRLPRMQELGLVFVIVVLGAVLSTYGWYDARPGHPNTFLNKDNLIDGIATPMSYYAIMAVGQTFVIITAGIDISVGAIMAVSALGSAALLIRVSPHCSPSMIVLLSVLAPLAIGLLCGLLNGLLIVALDLHPFIVTLGTMSIFRGVANVLPWDTLTNTLDPKTLVLPKATAALMKYQVAGVNIVPGIAMLICVVLCGIYLRLMVVGRENYAIGGNEEAARFSGLAVKRIKLRVYALSGLSAGIAGMVSLGRFGTASTSTGNTYELTVIAAAVVGGASLIGGRGTALGALLGTLVIAMIENGIYTLNLKQEYRLIIIGCAIVVAVSLDQISALIRQRRLARLGGRAA
jgi:ribose/xylose/arabinose/galactoside ABC-type transport system permease subunit